MLLPTYRQTSDGALSLLLLSAYAPAHFTNGKSGTKDRATYHQLRHTTPSTTEGQRFSAICRSVRTPLTFSVRCSLTTKPWRSASNEHNNIDGRLTPLANLGKPYFDDE
jgi:hypothetical protein